MWKYSQSTGQLFGPDGTLQGSGYAGAPGHVNVAADERLHQKGPLPRGLYTIGPAHTEPHLGPVAMRLFPDHDTVMYGRSDFFIHAANPAHPLGSSEGCIVLDSGTRSVIASSPDRLLEVVSGVVPS